MTAGIVNTVIPPPFVTPPAVQPSGSMQFSGKGEVKLGFIICENSSDVVTQQENYGK